MRWDPPADPFFNDTDPPVPNFTVTRFGIVCPAEKFRFDASGGAPPVGNTVRTAARRGAVTGTLSTTATAPVSGTTPRTATSRSTTDPAATLPTGAPLPTRVSRIRDGASDTNVPGSVGVPSR